MTIAHFGSEEEDIHKKQGRGTHCEKECGEGEIDSTYPCLLIKTWSDSVWMVWSQHLASMKPTPCQCHI